MNVEQRREFTRRVGGQIALQRAQLGRNGISGSAQTGDFRFDLSFFNEVVRNVDPARCDEHRTSDRNTSRNRQAEHLNAHESDASSAPPNLAPRLAFLGGSVNVRGPSRHLHGRVIVRSQHSRSHFTETAMHELPQPTFPLSKLGAPAAAWASPPPSNAQVAAAPHGVDNQRFEVSWARDADDVRQAQQLRFLVFAQEMGARLTVPKGTPAGLDVDRFDPFCEHLLVRAAARNGERAPVIGTYRVLTPAAAQRAGGWYSETEFDLTRLAPLRPNMVELGRSCVHPGWRSGGAVLALWGALAEFMQRNRLDTLIGCASVSMRDGGHFAASLWEQLRKTHPASAQWEVTPRMRLPVEDLRRDLIVEAPALIKGYLRCGAKLLGRPAWDPDFNTADLPLLLRVHDLPARYQRHFMGA